MRPIPAVVEPFLGIANEHTDLLNDINSRYDTFKPKKPITESTQVLTTEQTYFMDITSYFRRFNFGVII